MAEESKKLKEELALVDKLEQEQNELDFLRRVVKNQVTSEPISELMKSYTRQTLLPPSFPAAHNTRGYCGGVRCRPSLVGGLHLARPRVVSRKAVAIGWPGFDTDFG